MKNHSLSAAPLRSPNSPAPTPNFKSLTLFDLKWLAAMAIIAAAYGGFLIGATWGFAL